MFSFHAPPPHRLQASLFKQRLSSLKQRLTDTAANLMPWFFHSTDNPAPKSAPPHQEENRRFPRIRMTATTVQVTDGCLFATAFIDNISPTGICLRNLPEQLYQSTKQLTVFSSDDPGIPVLQIEPRWASTGWGGKTIGALILNVSDTWRLFFLHAAGQLEA